MLICRLLFFSSLLLESVFKLSHSELWTPAISLCSCFSMFYKILLNCWKRLFVVHLYLDILLISVILESLGCFFCLNINNITLKSCAIMMAPSIKPVLLFDCMYQWTLILKNLYLMVRLKAKFFHMIFKLDVFL
jgi:hypothetical protein